MQGQKTLFKSNSDEWSTPDDVFAELDNEFHFDLDPCADDSNYKCRKYFTVHDDGLKNSWGGTEYSVIPHTVGSRTGCGKHITSR